MTIDNIRKQSSVLEEMEAEGSIKIIGAMYDVSNGLVTFY
jgi:carbonic anhydrase